jgi:hypothetical protein
MAATFDPALTTSRDRARFALGDKHSDTEAGEIEEPLLQDSTIDAMIAQFGYREGLAQLAEGLVAEFAQMPDSITDDTLRMQWSSRLETWRKLAADTRAGVASTPGTTRTANGSALVQQTTAQSTLTSAISSGFRSD